MNPEVLVIHKPTSLFSDSQSDTIMNILRQHVDNVRNKKSSRRSVLRSDCLCTLICSLLLYPCPSVCFLSVDW